MNQKQPNYKKIYQDILKKKFPEKIKECSSLLSKQELSFLEIIALNQKIFGKKEVINENQKYRAYDTETIEKILDYQKKNKLNNTQLAIHFKLSRNTVIKWKKAFSDN